MYQVTLQQQSMLGNIEKYISLEIPTVSTTLRMLFEQHIQARLLAWQCNPKAALPVRGAYEQTLNDTNPQIQLAAWRERFSVDAQLQQAIHLFQRKHFMVLVDERQIKDIDEEFALAEHSTIQFIRLIPLIGG